MLFLKIIAPQEAVHHLIRPHGESRCKQNGAWCGALQWGKNKDKKKRITEAGWENGSSQHVCSSERADESVSRSAGLRWICKALTLPGNPGWASVPTMLPKKISPMIVCRYSQTSTKLKVIKYKHTNMSKCSHWSCVYSCWQLFPGLNQLH